MLFPKIQIKRQDVQFMEWNRCQFQAWPGFCNDNQQISRSGTKKVVFWLEEPSFTHGQLYDAASKVGDHQHIHFAVNKNVSGKTTNVIYREIL